MGFRLVVDCKAVTKRKLFLGGWIVVIYLCMMKVGQCRGPRGTSVSCMLHLEEPRNGLEVILLFMTCDDEQSHYLLHIVALGEIC